MLFTNTLDPPALELLKSLQDKSYLKGFYLVDGSALALYYGHRKSIDLDLFSDFGFDADVLMEQIHQDFSFQIYHSARNTLKGNINQINVDIIAHRYPQVGKPLFLDGMSILSDKDIVAMKLNAIATSGQRSKDFVDIYFALQKYSLREMMDFYKRKYNQNDDTHVLKSIIYFNDVDLSDWPLILENPGLKWATIKKKLESEVLQHLKSRM